VLAGYCSPLSGALGIPHLVTLAFLYDPYRNAKSFLSLNFADLTLER